MASKKAQKKRTKKRESAVCIHCIVKRHGRLEEFDERKIYGSVYAACTNIHATHKQSEQISEKVCKEIKAWIKKREQVDSDKIFKKTVQLLKQQNKDAAFMYETHRDIC